MPRVGEKYRLTATVEGFAAGTLVVVVEGGKTIPGVRPVDGGPAFYAPAAQLEAVR